MMYIILGIFVAIIMFSLIVLIHEWGHFATARKFGVKVEEFGLGIPPRAKKLFYDKKGTLFSLNWLPIGGFVKLTGEMPNTFNVFDKNSKIYNNYDLEKDIKNGLDIFDKNKKAISKAEKEEILKLLQENKADYNLANKKTWQQAIIILAGVFMNFLLAWFIFAILFMVGVSPIGINSTIQTDLDIKLIPTYEKAIESGLLKQNLGVILYPIEGSVAKNSNINEGDILYEVYFCNSGINQKGFCEIEEEELQTQIIKKPQDLINIVSENAGKNISLYINANVLNEEDSKNYQTPYLGGTIVSVNVPEDGKIGTYIGENVEINDEYKVKYGFFNSIKYGFLETKNQILLTFKGLGTLLQKIFNPETPEERQEAIESVSGPIGIVDFISKSITAGLVFIIVLGAIISINLGVFNLLPIPALDGGRLIFITINGLIKKIFGKKAISEQVEGFIHFGFFVLLIALSLIIAYNDINKIIAN